MLTDHNNGYILYTYFESPLGEMMVAATEEGICLLEFHDRKRLEWELKAIKNRLNLTLKQGAHPWIDLAINELKAYFSGELKAFTVPLHMTGTPFQSLAWDTLRTIPYGAVRSYSWQASAINKSSAVRAVANANSRNHIAIVIPCHRVIGSNGKLTGYAGGLWRKEWLIAHEEKYSHSQVFHTSG